MIIDHNDADAAQQNGISTRQATFRIGEQVNDGGQTTIGGATWSG